MQVVYFYCLLPQPTGVKRPGSPTELEKASKKPRVDDAEATVCCQSQLRPSVYSLLQNS